MSTELTTFNFEITSLKEAMEYAKIIANSDLAPKDYKEKAANVLVAIQYGNEIGLKPLQAIQNIAVINGRPCVWGDAMIALVQSHPLCEYIREEFKNDTAYCTVKRRGEEEHTSSFSKNEAEIAGLSKKEVWKNYPKRMLQMRARAYALRDKFSDILKGIAMREEAMDYQEGEFKVVQEQEVAKLNESLGLVEKKEPLKIEQTYEMSQLCKDINESDSLESLKSNFNRCCKLVKENKNHLNILIEIKDKRKEEINKKEVDEFKNQLGETSLEADGNGEIV